MKKFYLIILLLNIQLFSQIQTYDFGTGTGNPTGPYTTPGESFTYLPDAPLTTTTTRVYIGSGGGQFNLVNPGTSLGTDSELQCNASNAPLAGNNIINKFSIYNLSTASTLFSLRFSFRLEGGEDGSEWFMVIGKNGGYFQNGFAYVNTVFFCAVKFQFSTTNAINTYVNLDNGWGSALPWGITTATNHIIEIFANNSTSAAAYNYNGSETLAAGSYDLWLDGTRVRNDDVRNGLAVGDILDSFAFIGRLSTGNAAVIYLDDFFYSTSLENGPLPVELTFFNGALNGNKVELRWKTETEVDNYGFDIERTTDNSDWKVIGFVEGHGNSNSPKQYAFSDSDIGQSAKYYYRLKQIDTDGKFEYSDVVSVEVGVPGDYSLSQNYPNPFNPSTRIDFSIPSAQSVKINVYNMLGEQVAELVNGTKEAGSYSVIFNASDLPSGIYIYELITPDVRVRQKLMLLK